MILRINTRTPAVHVFVLFFCSIKKRSRSKTIQLDPLAEHIYISLSAPLRRPSSSIPLLACLLGPTVETRNQKQARDRSKMEEPQQAPNNKANKSSSRFRRVCVFCGSSPGKKAAYQLAAVQLGHHLVDRGIDLVYGGGSVGLMGLVSRAVHNGGGHVLGIVPKAVLPLELIGDTPGELRDVPGMHQRKAEMARHSDAFIALPGGYGTLEELLEVITWAQLGIHSKPVGLLNVDGYYDSLLSFVDRAVQEGFVTSAARSILVAAAAPHDLLAKLEDYVPVHDDATPNLTWEFSR